MGSGGSKTAEVYKSRLEDALKCPVPASNTEFWEAFWMTPTTADEVFACLTAEQLRDLKSKAPRNLATLLVKVVGHMRKVVAQGPANKKEDYAAALNCVRIVTRLLPFVMEDQSDDFFDRVFWRNEIPEWIGEAETKDDPPSEGGEDGRSETGENPAEDVNEDDKSDAKESEEETDDNDVMFEGEDSTDPLAIRLLNAVVNLLFYPHFTVMGSKPPEEPISALPSNHCWATGVEVKAVLPSNRLMDSYRCEVLKCMLVMFAEAFYHLPDEAGHYVNKWLDIVACNHSFHSKAIFLSLLNVVLSYDPVGWGVPYNHLMFGDYLEGLADTCLQVLVVLANHTPSPLISRSNSEAEPENIFCSYLGEIKDEEDFKLIHATVVRLLQNPMHANNTYLPNSTKKIGCHQELLMFFWKLIQVNEDFLNWLLVKSDVTPIIDPILHMLYQGRKDSTQSGLVHLGTFVMLFLSGSREFGVQLNRPFKRKLRIDLPPFTGNYADYMILVYIKMLLDGDRLDSLFECLLTIITNVSPYIKSLAMITNIRLMHLFKVFSRPKYLFSSERAHRYVFFLLEIFNNSIQYQYSGNYRLIYAMIRNKELFTALANISLDAGDDDEPGEGVSPSTPKSPTGGESAVATDEGDEAKSLADDAAAGVGDGSGAAELAEAAVVEDRTIPAPIEESVTVTPSLESTDDSTFKPTKEWLMSWKNQLPLSTSLRLLNATVPHIPSLVSGSSNDEKQILEYLTNTTLVGLLPVPHPILIRRYQHNTATETWLNTYMWGVVYLRNETPPLFFTSDIKLFVIKMVDG